MTQASASPVGLLLSGGTDSSILLARLLEEGRCVQPFYVRCGLLWEPHEVAAAKRFLQAVSPESPRGLVILDLPLADLYGEHWSVDGRNTPDAQTPDEAVYLPGRNPLLLIKPAIWCQLHGIETLVLAPLVANPFADATDEFFRDFQAALCRAGGRCLQIERPFAGMTKPQVLQLGRHDPLHLTFSCIGPVAGRHCGACNKCQERRKAFESIGLEDPTLYAKDPLVESR